MTMEEVLRVIEELPEGVEKSWWGRWWRKQ